MKKTSIIIYIFSLLFFLQSCKSKVEIKENYRKIGENILYYNDDTIYSNSLKLSKDSNIIYNSEIILHGKNELNIKTVEDILNNEKYILTPNGVEIYANNNLISIDEDYINFDQNYAGIQKIDLSSSGIYKYIKINKHEIVHHFNLYNSKTAIHYLGNNYIISNAVLSFTTYKGDLNTMFTLSGMEYIGITEETREPYHIELIFYYPKYEDKPW